MDRYLMFYVQSPAKGHNIRAKQNCFPTTSKNYDALLNTHFTIEDLEKLKLNEPGRQKLGRHSSPVSRHSIQSYMLTYYRLRKREPLIALGFHEGGP